MQEPAVWVPTLQVETFLDTVVPFIGLTVWQLLLLVAIVLAIFVAGKLVRSALTNAFKRTPLPEDMERRIAKTSTYLVWIVGLLFVPGIFGINLGSMVIFGFRLPAILTAVVLAIVFYLAANVVSALLTRVFQRTDFPEDIEKSLVSASRLLVYVVGVFAVFAGLGMDLTALVLGLGAFSIALSFALSDIIKNVTSGLLVQADKPFYPGDTIKVGKIEGKVIKTKIRTTILETKEGHIAYIPNTWFTTKEIINRTRRRETGTTPKADDVQES
ncbi:MAG: mechanosensitive ion channel [Candidatus Thermoplasmatota archaeon]|nr:mechanosensitive ion channel [Candidatus Thermoplasmatota archaeon]